MRRKSLLGLLGPLFFLFIVLLFSSIYYLGRYELQQLFVNEKKSELVERANDIHDEIRTHIEKENFDALSALLKSFDEDHDDKFALILPTGESFGELTSRVDFDVREALQGKVAHFIGEENESGMIYLNVSTPIKRENGEILGVIRSSSDFEGVREATSDFSVKLILIGSTLVVLLVALLVWLYRLTVVPIHEMILVTRKYSQSDFKAKMDPSLTLTKELHILSSSLNEMGRKIQDQFEKVWQQRSERETVFSSMVEGILSVRFDGSIFHFNKSVCHIFEVEYSPDLRGKNIVEVFRDMNLMNIVKEVIDSGEVIEREILVKGEKVLQVHGSTLKKNEEEDLGILLVFNDVTKLRKLEQHRKEFVANVSHELRTPLTSIQGFVENLLEDKDLPEEVRTKFLEIIKKNSARLYQLIEDLLFLSEIEKGGQEIEFEFRPLLPWVKSAISLCEPKALAKSIRIDLKITEDFAVRAKGDLISQVFSNLLENAIKFSPEGSVITVGLEVQNENLVFSVNDQGPGIEKKHQERLFERFYSADEARSRELGGKGLGLSIAKNIAAAHGAEVALESEVGSGSTFMVIWKAFQRSS